MELVERAERGAGGRDHSPTAAAIAHLIRDIEDHEPGGARTSAIAGSSRSTSRTRTSPPVTGHCPRDPAALGVAQADTIAIAQPTRRRGRRPLAELGGAVPAESAGSRTHSRTIRACGSTSPAPTRCSSLAHGAGSGMRSPFMAGFAEAIGRLGVATLRFEFPYMQAGRRAARPAAGAARARGPRRSPRASRERRGRPVFAGGKSMGGRIASMAAAEGMAAAGLVFLGYPLHPPGRPEKIRDAHLDAVAVPMLFLQGTRDTFARPDLLAAASWPGWARGRSTSRSPAATTRSASRRPARRRRDRRVAGGAGGGVHPPGRINGVRPTFIQEGRGHRHARVGSRDPPSLVGHESPATAGPTPPRAARRTRGARSRARSRGCRGTSSASAPGARPRGRRRRRVRSAPRRFGAPARAGSTLTCSTWRQPSTSAARM